jgi:plastocyanin
MSATTKWVIAAVVVVAVIGVSIPVVAAVGWWLTPVTAPPPRQAEPDPRPVPDLEAQVTLPKADSEPKPAEPPKPAGATPEKTPAPAAPAGDWVTIKGRVVWPDGAPLPTARKIDVTTDKEHCLEKGDLVHEDILVNPKTRGVKNVVVWLRPDSTNRRDPFPQDRIHPDLAKAKPAHHVIDQPCCQFEPRVVAARAGDTLEVKNSAPVAHNINMSADNPAFTFNITLPPGKSYKPASPLTEQSTPIPFKCDIHPWMAGRVRVFDHPYFAVTDEDGNFEIRLAPAGNWRIMYWHENGYHKGRDGALGFPIEATKGAHLELPPVGLELPK